MLFLRLAIFIAAASAAIGPSFGWNSTSLEKYGLLFRTLAPPPSADEQFVQIAAASAVANSGEAMFRAVGHCREVDERVSCVLQSLDRGLMTRRGDCARAR